MSAVLKYRYSLLAGACAAGGSFFGKMPGFLSSLQLLQPEMQDINAVLGACSRYAVYTGLTTHVIERRLSEVSAVSSFCAALLRIRSKPMFTPKHSFCLAEFILLRLMPLALMVLCNVLNWRYFLRALQAAEQTLTATVLTAASNYVISFILGTLFYGEPISTLTVLGSTLIVVGLWFLCAVQVKKQDNYKFKKT